MIDIGSYFEEIRRVYATGQATEHSYRPALQKLFDSIAKGVKAINEPTGSIRVGRPDFVFVREAGKNTLLTVGHCEAKDIDMSINPKEMNEFNKGQHKRYTEYFGSLIYTNGLDFHFYKKGKLDREVSIAKFADGIQPQPEQFTVLANLLLDFATQLPQFITSAAELAKMMATKAKLIKDILSNALNEDKDLQTDLVGQYQSFKKMLIHDLTSEDFSDIYAETVAYGMFGARLHDKTLENFSRAEALELMPKSNPFLRYLFNYIAGPDLDERIRRTIDELAEIFQATDLPKLFEDFGKFTQRNDPFIDFYENFLEIYNPKKRKERGVWYTPEPVVNFIVRAVDDVLKTEFGLADGLADTSKVTVDWDTGQTKNNKPVTIKKEVHRVQILDPAAGTGTFLAEVIKQIAPRVKDVAEGQWSNYVEKELIPRLHGFELLMASYAMCHMKLDMMLTEMGYKPTANPPRMGVYLTNSLEEGDREIQDLFWAKPLSEEAKQANTIKRDMPIMCVIGNPPYSGESSNTGKGFEWIMSLMEDYKKEPGSHLRLDERNPKWINDDYMKFIRFAQHMIEKNGEGVLGFITNHGYLDNPTFRGMRWHLLKTFDKIWVLDLHGSSQKKEVPPDGPADKNVFNIKPGVAIIIAVKKNNNKSISLAEVSRGDIFGTQKQKHEKLQSSVSESCIEPIELRAPRYFFRHWDYELEPIWEAGFSIDNLMKINSNGIVTGNDGLLIAESREQLLVNLTKKEIVPNGTAIEAITYRPFESHVIYNDPRFIERDRKDVMRHYKCKDQIGLLVSKQVRDFLFSHVFITRQQSEAIFLSGTTATNAMNAPLYLYPDEQSLDQNRRVNFDPKIRKAIEAAATDKARGVPNEVAIFDYIYGVLHCPAYRETYKEFLKIDFPRVPYPASPDVFWDVSAKGTQLRKLHLMEDVAVGLAPYKFVGDGDSKVVKVEFRAGSPLSVTPDQVRGDISPARGENQGKEAKEEVGAVYINPNQCFENVPRIAWEFYIGGYQPAQKWLKDRKGRELSFEDIRHYQKIIKILSETDRIMKTITMPLVEK